MSTPMKNSQTAPLSVSSAVRDYLAAIGRKGGSATSERKSKAARRNAKKGGWPKGRPRKQRIDAHEIYMRKLDAMEAEHREWKQNAERHKAAGGGGRNATKRSGAGSQNDQAQRRGEEKL